MKNKKVIFSLVAIIFLIVILSNFKILLFDKSFYFDEYKNNHTYKTFKTDYYELQKTTISVVTYLAFGNNNELLDLKINDQSILTNKEQLHMRDVQRLIQGGLSLLVILYVLLTALILLHIRNNKIMRSVFLYSGITLIGFCLFVVLSMYLNFDYTFEIFHKIFFTGNYSFPLDSKLILLFPITFFFDAGYRILTHSFIIGMGFTAIGYMMPKR